MARSALDILNDHIGGGQAKLVAYRKQYSGSGQYVAPTSFKASDEKLLESLIVARDLLDAAKFGPDDPGFTRALERWVGLEYGAYFDFVTLKPKKHLPRPAKQELLRGHGKGMDGGTSQEGFGTHASANGLSGPTGATATGDEAPARADRAGAADGDLHR